MWMVIPPVLASKTNDGLILNHDFGFLVPGFWCLVFGAWFLVPGFWCLVFGAWFLVPGSSCLVFRKDRFPSTKHQVLRER